MRLCPASRPNQDFEPPDSVMTSATHIHEQDFCAEVAKWSKEFFDQNKTSPFSDARIEGLGTGSQRRKKKDLRIYGRNAKIAITGEVKLPGTLDGRSPYAADLVQDAQTKADNSGAQYFFTWNVNTFLFYGTAISKTFLCLNVECRNGIQGVIFATLMMWVDTRVWIT
jgi:hypothetical protein